MRVLCACECSQSLTSAFIRRGVDAYSCDVEPTTCRSGKSWIQSMSSSSPKRSYLDPYLADAMACQWSEYL